jgi:hypothetical protein
MFLTGLGATASRIWSLQKRTSRGIPRFSSSSYNGNDALLIIILTMGKELKGLCQI